MSTLPAIKLNKGFKPKTASGLTPSFDLFAGYEKITQFIADLQRKEQILDRKIVEADRAIARAGTLQKGAKGDAGPAGGPVGPRGLQGPPGPRGSDGYTPIKGLDYFTESEVKDMIRTIATKVPLPLNGRDGRDANVEAVIKEVLKALESGKVKLTSKHIVGLDGELTTQRSYLRLGGGGGGIAAGDIYQETPVGDIDSANLTYTVTKPINKVLNFAINGQFLHLTTDYSFSSKTITFVTALDSSLSGKPFQITYV